MGAAPSRFPFFAEGKKESHVKGHASHAKHRDNGRDEHFRSLPDSALHFGIAATIEYERP